MSRLIDADEAVREYEACIENYILSGNDPKSRYIEDWEYVIKQLSNRPTAYDVEAVVRELEAKSTYFAHKAEYEKDIGYAYVAPRKYGISDGLDLAIEIVRGGWND